MSLAVALLRPDHKVAVGDIVKVTNGQHLPADMVIVSSRSDSLYVYVDECVYVSVNVCPPLTIVFVLHHFKGCN